MKDFYIFLSYCLDLRSITIRFDKYWNRNIKDEKKRLKHASDSKSNPNRKYISINPLWNGLESNRNGV